LEKQVNALSGKSRFIVSALEIVRKLTTKQCPGSNFSPRQRHDRNIRPVASEPRTSQRRRPSLLQILGFLLALRLAKCGPSPPLHPVLHRHRRRALRRRLQLHPRRRGLPRQRDKLLRCRRLLLAPVEEAAVEEAVQGLVAGCRLLSSRPGFLDDCAHDEAAGWEGRHEHALLALRRCGILCAQRCGCLLGALVQDRT
jgi:hypothetical protein